MHKQIAIRNLILILLFSFCLTGCSLLPRLTFDTPNTVPQNVDRSKVKATCKGEAIFNDVGDMISCSKGYYNYEEGYQKVERKMNFVERIKSFINSLIGWGFWGIVLLIVLVPGLAGTLLGRLIEGTIGITGKSLKSVVSAVQKTRKTGKDLNDSLSAEQDADVKAYIAKLKKQEKIKQ